MCYKLEEIKRELILLIDNNAPYSKILEKSKELDEYILINIVETNIINNNLEELVEMMYKSNCLDKIIEVLHKNNKGELAKLLFIRKNIGI